MTFLSSGALWSNTFRVMNQRKTPFYCRFVHEYLCPMLDKSSIFGKSTKNPNYCGRATLQSFASQFVLPSNQTSNLAFQEKSTLNASIKALSRTIQSVIVHVDCQIKIIGTTVEPTTVERDDHRRPRQFWFGDISGLNLAYSSLCQENLEYQKDQR